MTDFVNLIPYFFSGVIALLSAGWFSAWWISRMRDDIKDLINSKIEALEDTLVRKLEYHEKHDDERFNIISKDVIELRIKEASRDAKRHV